MKLKESCADEEINEEMQSKSITKKKNENRLEWTRKSAKEKNRMKERMTDRNGLAATATGIAIVALNKNEQFIYSRHDLHCIVFCLIQSVFI